MRLRLLVCAVFGHREPDQAGAAFRYSFAVTTTIIAPHDIPNEEHTRAAWCCPRCGGIWPREVA